MPFGKPAPREARYLRTVDVWTDGACFGPQAGASSGRGAYAAILEFADVDEDDVSTIELSRAYVSTTSTRMELLAVVAALERLSSLFGPCRVFIHTDCAPIVDVFYAPDIQARIAGVANEAPAGHGRAAQDLWDRLVAACRSGHVVEMAWVHAHSGVPSNERANKLAKQAAKSDHFHLDPGCPATGSNKGSTKAGGDKVDD